MLVGAMMFVNIAAIGALYVALTLRKLPPLDEFNTRQVNQSTKLFDRTGKILLYEIHGEEKRTVVPFEQIPETLKWATLVAENANFYNEPAFDWKAIVRAFIANVKEGKIIQGGSTITQQLVKNVFLTPEKTFARKIKELILAIELESKYPKQKIFEFYLNQIPYGSNAYGVEAASQTYFGKPVGTLTLEEAASIASLPKAPSYYSPWGTHKDELLQRKNYILERMEEFGYVSKEEKERAQKKEIVFAPPSIGVIKAPHFSLAVKDALIEMFGEERALKGGLRVFTALDWEMQGIAEKAVAEGALRNEELYSGTNASLVAQDSNTGEILALVGSRDYFDKKIDGNFNVATQGLRQPGSALKPFAYLTAFEKGYSPKTMVFDVPTEFDTTGNPEKSYQPQNFDEKFRGPVSFEEGLAQSINVPSVKVLYLAGISNVLNNIHKFGVSTLKEFGRYGLSLILGGGEVKLIDLVGAYSVFAEEGTLHAQTFILKIEDANGKTVYERRDDAKRVIDPQYPRLVSQILSDKQLRSALFQNSLALTVFPERDVALKTGTTNDYRDAWALGYTPSLVVGVWAGNNDNAPMQKHGSSILAAVPIWNAFLKEVIEKYPKELFTRPDPLPPANKPMLNGEAFFTPIINNKAYPQIHSILSYVQKNDPLGPIPENPRADFQFENWETGVVLWAQKNIPNFYEYNQQIPISAAAETGRPSPSGIVITNIAPANGEFIASPFTVSADITSARAPLSKIELRINGEFVNAFALAANSYKLQYYSSKPLESQNVIEIKATNNLGEEQKAVVIVFGK